MAEIIGDYGNHYADGFEYAIDTKRYDKPMNYDGDHTGTISISPSWNAWVDVVKKNEDAFKGMSKDEIDDAFHFFDGGYQWGLVDGLKMTR